VLVIRTEQMSALQASSEICFIDRVVEHIEIFHEEAIAGIEAAELRRRVVVGLARARSHGIDHQDLLTAFVALLFVIAPNFDEHPVIRATLRRSVGEDLGERLVALPRSCWSEARQAADPRAWKAGT
jgi:hypothetical protein